MSSHIVPTTKAQVSGHRFLQRRVEHGLVLGDIRMIHDPFGPRRRALTFGIVAVVLISVGAGLIAWLRPAADPGEAPILQSADGALFVRVEEMIHPVANLASARLIAGEAAAPARIGDELLTDLDWGVPLGIHPAPLVLDSEASSLSWAVCSGDEGVTVLAGPSTSPLGGHRGVLAVGAEKEWVLTTHGRAELPHPDAPEGRVIRRALGISVDTPRWEPPIEVLNAAAELTPMHPPEVLPEVVLDTGTGSWARLPSGIASLTRIQAEILGGLGVPIEAATVQEIAELDDAPLDPGLPTLAPIWVDTSEVTICADGAGQVGTLPPDLDGPAPVELAGESIAHRFMRASAGALAVDTGHGFHVVDGTGLRHPVSDTETLIVLGLSEPAEAPWPILRLLPEGEPLSMEGALQAIY